MSPLPPERTGIAGYSAKLLPNLARHYEIICIVDQPEVTDPWITSEFAIRDLSWFEANADRFERILYQFGNSASHKHMFALLEDHPGVVVLHEFYLSGVLDWMENAGYAPSCFTKALYDSHGFSALKKDREEGREKSIRAFPCSASVLRKSIGVIAHSSELVELVRRWWGDEASVAVRELPFSADAQQAADLSQRNDPEKTAALYRDIIEETYTTGSQGREQNLVRAIARTPAPGQPSDADLVNVAAALAANRGRFGLRQILIDVAILAQHDAGTGIQRVVRAILMALIKDPPAGYRVEPVRVEAGNYLYARRFVSRFLALPEDCLTDDAVEAGPEDIFIGMDWCAEFVPAMKPWFLARRRHGLQIVFVGYDVLPLRRPDLFPEIIPPLARNWISAVAEIADGVVCISRTVADELYEWLSKLEPKRLQPLRLGFFHLGADVHASLPTTGLSQDASAFLGKLRSRPSFLMVGTMEPRKGHGQALAAMERLWADGIDANLIIIGKRGWKTDDLAEQIQRHPEYNHRLFWHQGISDEMLEHVYRATHALLAASEGEGFGLPLIEAAQYGLPIIARDIPVFREVAGEHAYYFRGEEPQALAEALRAWLSLGDAAPRSIGISWLTWQQSSRQLLDVVLGGRWYRSWPDAACNLLSETVCH